MGKNLEDNFDTAILHLWLNNIEGIESNHIHLLKNKLGSVWNIFDAGKAALKSIIPEDIAEIISGSKKLDKTRKLYDRLLDKGISYIYPEHSNYPYKLKNISCPPQLLYIKGKLSNLEKLNNLSIGVVGSRNPSTYGREIGRYFAGELADKGIGIISGLARGIDGEAHKAVLDKGGFTAAVLGCGINVIYPVQNMEIYNRIQDSGIIMSEYGLDFQATKWTFPVRNRIISGLSDGVLVVEARAKSGSLITVDHGLEQGKQIYAIPGRLMDKNCEGTNNLIRQGAICVNSPEDILEDLLGLDYNEKTIIKEESPELTPPEEKIIGCLGLEPVYIDDIIQATCLGITKTISTLYLLEEKRRIKQPIRGYYILHI